MSEEKSREQKKEERTEDHPDTEKGKDATDRQVEREEETGGALPQNHSDED